GRILKEEAEKVLEDMRRKVNAKFATGQTDGWKNIAKSLLIGSIVNVEFAPWLLNIFDISATVKSAENLLALVISEIKYCMEVLHTVIVTWCTDASGESRKMRRLLQQKFPWIITVDCWAHQINLVVGDYFKLKSTVSHTMDDALEVAKWFNNHSRALGLLHDQQVTCYGSRALWLILPVITRWTAHYLTCTWLLELEKAIRTLVLEQREALITCVGDKRDARDKAQSIITIVITESFWSKLRMLQKHLEPLAITANVLQADNARLDTVLMTLGSLYGIFSQVEIYDNCEVFILAVVLNPYLRTAHFNRSNPALIESELWNMLKCIYQCMMQLEPTFALMQAFTDYIHQLGRYSDDAMALAEIKAAAHSAKADINLVIVWRRLHCSATNEDGGLVSFAMCVLSIVPNSAATEQLFSKMGVVQSKHQSCLGSEKVCQMVLIREAVEKQYPRPYRRKLWCFGGADHNCEDIHSDNESPDSDIQVEQTDTIQSMMDIIGDEDDTGSSLPADMASPTIGSESATSCTSSEAITFVNGLLLMNIFDYSQSLPNMLDAWCRGGEILQTEMEFHDVLAELLTATISEG
ncbi:hypothetical protein WOLCODRAFT_85990, partial [Wolfiporia cocos MD-104 SS10]